MADIDEKEEVMTTAELSEEQRRIGRASSLSVEIAERYDPARLSKLVVSQAGRGERLDLDTVNEMERKIGGNFSDVRVIRGPFAEAITRHHRADAVTVANTGLVLVREGPRSNFGTRQGKALLAHELTHVKQAQRGLHFALEDHDQDEDSEHEEEARRVEFSELDSAQRKQATEAKVSTDGERRRQLFERVLELMEQDDRNLRARLGID
jgi:hypothetical protein